MSEKQSLESQAQEKPLGTGQVAVEPPALIINLPDDPEASLAESKFKKAVYALAKAFPRIDEARANVKTHPRTGSRTRFEVDVFVEIPGHPRFEFVQEGWDLLEVFDRISDKLKELMTKPKEKTSYRNYPPRSEITVETE